MTTYQLPTPRTRVGMVPVIYDLKPLNIRVEARHCMALLTDAVVSVFDSGIQLDFSGLKIKNDGTPSKASAGWITPSAVPEDLVVTLLDEGRRAALDALRTTTDMIERNGR